MMKQNRLGIFLYFCLGFLVLVGTARVYYRLTDDFRLGNMIYPEAMNHEFTVPPLSTDEQADLFRLLHQPFHYIGKGAQCYAFASEDGNYVLKFFKFKHLKPNWLVQLLPSIFPFKHYKEQVIERKKRKLDSVFQGYDLAYKENKMDSELIYLHLKPTNYLHQSVTVRDKIGFEWKINLDEVVFLVQKKGETLRTHLNYLFRNRQLEEAKKSIGDILSMYKQEYGKGLYDRDHGVMHNTGFVGEHPFHLDVGKFTKDSRMKQVDFFKKDLEHIIWKIDRWIHLTYPQDHALFSSYLSAQYQFYTGESLDIALIDSQKFKKKRHE
jgi:hypothetical protein